MKTLVLTKKDVTQLLDVKEAFKAAERAYRVFGEGMVMQPPILSIEVPEHNGEIDIKSGYNKTDEIVGFKVASGYSDNPMLHGLPSMYSLICLFDAKTSFPVCIMESGGITYYRTSAAGAYAASVLARPDAKVMAVMGSGGLGKMHLRATLPFFNIRQVNVFDMYPEARAKYIAEMSLVFKDLKFVNCETAKEAVETADIISTATNSHKFYINKAWIKPGTHINAFGCDMVGKQELDPELFRSSKVVVDCTDECVYRGETQHSIKSGILKRDDIYAEIGEIALGKKLGRTDDNEITVFDSVGLSIQDLSIAHALYTRAIELGLGTPLDFC